MRGFTVLTVCVGVLVGLQAAWAAGPLVPPPSELSVTTTEPPTTRQLGQVVGSFTFPDPPVAPSENVVGIAHDGDGGLWCTDFTAPQFFLVNPTEPSAQLLDGPFDILAHSASPVGITTDGSHVYIGDTTGDDIDVFDLDGNYERSFSVASQTGFPEGITFNPITRHLYVVDGQLTNTVFEFALDGTYVGDFTINGFSQDGLAFDRYRCSYWIYDGGPQGTDTVRHYDLDFVEMETFPGPLAAGYGYGDGLAVIGNHLYVTTMVGSAATVVIFDIADAMVSDLCDIFADGFESGDSSAWSTVVP